MADRSRADNWSYKTCKAPVESSPATNEHQTSYMPDLPSLSTYSVKAMKGNVSSNLWDLFTNTVKTCSVSKVAQTAKQASLVCSVCLCPTNSEDTSWCRGASSLTVWYSTDDVFLQTQTRECPTHTVQTTSSPDTDNRMSYRPYRQWVVETQTRECPTHRTDNE